MATRSELQSKNIKDLRSIAQAIGIPTSGVQKAKLIDAIMGAGAYDGSDSVLPIDLPEVVSKEAGTRSTVKTATKPARTASNGEAKSAPDSDPSAGEPPGKGKSAPPASSRAQRAPSPTTRQKPTGRQRVSRPSPAPQRKPEVRTGTLDILPEGYGFPVSYTHLTLPTKRIV